MGGTGRLALEGCCASVTALLSPTSPALKSDLHPRLEMRWDRTVADRNGAGGRGGSLHCDLEAIPPEATGGSCASAQGCRSPLGRRGMKTHYSGAAVEGEKWVLYVPEFL